MNLWYKLEESLKEEIKDRKQEFKEHSCPDYLLHEIVDSFVPIYHAHILDITKANMDICYAENEGLYSNDMDIFKRLQIGIYEQLMPVAYEVFEKFQLRSK